MRLELFERFVKQGELTLVDVDGARHRFGSGTPKVTWLMRHPDALRRIVTNPALELGETYMDEGWDVADGSLADLITILRGNMGDLVQRRTIFSEFAALVQTWNALKASLRNVHHHYDLDEELFRAFLDRDMHYSCAYFRELDMSLESAQMAKCNHIARKLLLEPGQQMLDIGCGWGGLALHLAETVGVSVVGLDPELGAVARRTRRRGSARPHGPRRVPLAGLSRAPRPVRSHRQRRHVRTRRAAQFPTLLRAAEAAAAPARCRDCCTRSVPRGRRTRQMPGSADTSFPVVTFLRCRRWRPPSRGRA